MVLYHLWYIGFNWTNPSYAPGLGIRSFISFLSHSTLVRSSIIDTPFPFSSIVPGGGDVADYQLYHHQCHHYRCRYWKNRTSYCLGNCLDQPYRLSEVFLVDQPVSPFAFWAQVLVRLLREGVEVLQVPGRCVLAAGAVAAAVVALAAPREVVVLDSPQAHAARRQT